MSELAAGANEVTHPRAPSRRASSIVRFLVNIVAASAACVVLAACARTSGSAAPSGAPSVTTASPASDGAPNDAFAIAPDAESPSPVDAGWDAPADAATSPRARTRKRQGVACGQSSECAAGLACCESGFHGHCGGAYMPDQQLPPCVMTTTCETAPCTPLALPPAAPSRGPAIPTLD
jgi:hypothetical protein